MAQSNDSTRDRRPRILLLNPNSNAGMTQAMNAVANSTIVSSSLDVVSYTCASGSCTSINDQDDIDGSAASIWQDINDKRAVDPRDYDAVLVACFSVHPLVRELEDLRDGLAVTGIFEAGVQAAVALAGTRSQWGIITTGEFWEKHLTDGVEAAGAGAQFAGTFSTGLTAGEMHSLSPDEVRDRLSAAARRLLEKPDVRCIVMGCGGMAGLEETIRATAREVHGDEVADNLYIIDGVKAGIMYLYQVLGSKKMYSAHKP